MKKVTCYLIFLISILSQTWSQELFYLEEGFEDPESISKWTVTPLIINKEWEYTYGGQWLSGGDPYNPEIPAQGDYNAGLYYPSLNLDTVKLISPFLELNGTGKPTLRFFHCQYEKIFKGPDFLRLYFRSKPSANWDLIQQWTSDISYWKDEIFDIEHIHSKYLTDSFQLAFEGIIGNGYGVYVDSVTVREDTILQKFVKKTTYKSLEYSAIPAGATNIPLEEITIRVLGNTGNIALNSLTVIPDGNGVAYLETDSFKLFCTNNDEVFAPFHADTLAIIATATLSSGQVTFNNIGKELLLGNNHFWISASFKNTLAGQASVHFSVPVNGINVSGNLFPGTSINFDKSHLIKETVFYDDFETGGAGWNFEGDFEIGWPAGNPVSSQSNPKTPFNGNNILATDLDGGYEPNIDSTTSYYAYMPEQDLTYYNKVGLYLQSFFLINGPDNAVIDASTDGGISWQNIWMSDPSSNNSYWSEFYDESINEIAKRQPSFQIRFGITESKIEPWPGFAMDNFALIAEKLYSDVGITQIPGPFNGCVNCGNDTVKVWIKNYAVNPAPNFIPVYYGLWGADSIIVQDTLIGGINKDDSVLFTFSKLANFPKGDYYNKFVVGVGLSGDQDPLNDTLTKPLIIQNNLTPPLFENFEYKGGIWLPSKNSTWTNKNMSGTIITDPLSPKIWVLSPTGNYRNNDTSYVESGCYNLSETSRNIIQLKYWSDCENSKDGARFEYTIDNGDTWKIMEDTLYNALWNWTTSNVTALGSHGWSGLHEWTTAKTLIPADADSSENVKFRLLFMSDAINSQAQGFAFDDLRVFPTPIDAGVSFIELPADACQFINPDSARIYVKNYGYTPITPTDTIVVGVDFESNSPVIKTYILSNDLLPGDSIAFKMPLPMNIDNPGNYSLFAYTLIEDDPFYYNSNNDTTWKSFNVWLNPTTGLDDTIYSRQPDTVMIRPRIEATYSYLWGDNSTTNYYDVTSPGYYYLTVTESNHNCKIEDSIFIQLLFNDVGVDSIIWPHSTCELSNSEKVEVFIRNFGTDSLITGDLIKVYYQIDGGIVIKDSVTLNTAFHSGGRRSFRFDHKTENFSDERTYAIKSYAYFGGDTLPQNDTINRQMTVYGYPEIYIGEDTTIKGLTYNLAADPTFSTYLWSDGDTVSTKLITSSGIYSLTVTDQYGCPAADTINIWFKIRDIKAYSLLSPLSSCSRTGTEQVKLKIQNSGTDTIKISDDIIVSFKLNSNSRVNNTIHVNNLLPGQTTEHLFTPTVDLTAYDTYTFNTTATTTGDLRITNDTLIKLVYTKTNPVVDLGIENGEQFKQTSYTFDAGAGENLTYLWQDGSKNRYYTATNTGTIKSLVTDTTTGCYGGDTADLYLDILDYRVSSISINANTCQGLYEDLTVQVRNSGNLPRGGADFTLKYVLNNTLLFTESYTQTTNWPANSNKTFTVKNPINLNTSGNNQLKIIINHLGDLRPENDTLTKQLTVKSNPVVDLGGPSIYTDLPYLIDAGAGQQSYLWNTGATTSSLTVNQNGVYSVIVTGTNGCETKAVVGINVEVDINETLNEGHNVNIYPNPASENVTIEAVFNHEGTCLLELFSTQNSLILSKEINTIDFKESLYIGNLAPGIYYIRIRNNEYNFVSKLIIQ